MEQNRRMEKIVRHVAVAQSVGAATQEDEKNKLRKELNKKCDSIF